MIITEQLLKKYFSIDNYDWNEFQLLVNDYIVEIDKSKKFKFSSRFIIGKIIEFKKIPNIEFNIYLVTVDINKKKNLTIVCKSYYLEKNKKVVVDLEEAYDQIINDICFINEGTICLAKDLLERLSLNKNLLTEKEKQGILFLDDKESFIGQNFLEYLNLKGGLFKLNVTPDRGDLLSYIGFSQDLKIIYDVDKFKFNYDFLNEIQEKNLNPFQVQIINKNCLEYNVCYIQNITVKTSPLWLRNLLFIHDIIPVNNIIDIINFVLIEYGIPLEVFDVTHLEEKKIKIRNAFDGENIQCYNNKKYLLNNNNLVVSNKKNIMSIAGVINSNINDIKLDTKEIIITTSLLNPSNILQTIKQFNIENEKTLRLSKGIDHSLITQALKKAVLLLQKLDPKIIISDIKYNKIKNKINPTISFSLSELYNKIGIYFSLEEVKNFLTKLDYEIKIINKNLLQVKAPSRRYDVIMPEDVFSDIVRSYGYKKIKTKELSKTQIAIRNEKQEKIYKIKNLLSNLGFYEVINYSLVNQKILNLFPHSSDYVQVKNPISQEQIILRQHLSGNMIQTLSYNQKHNNYDNAFFEIGNVYHKTQEKLHLSLGLSGNLGSRNWNNSNTQSSFFVLKGVLYKICLLLGIKFDFRKNYDYSNLHPGQQAGIFYKDKKIGFIGKIHPSLECLYFLKQSFIAEIDLDQLNLENSKKIIFEPITKFPSIIRDLSFLISKKYSFENIIKNLIEDMPCFLVKCKLLDIYECEKISPTKHSLSFRFVFNDKNKSLSNEAINEIMKKIENKIKNIYEAQIR